MHEDVPEHRPDPSHIDIEQLQREVASLRRELQRAKKQHNPWNPIALGGAVLTLLGVVGTSIIGYVGTGDGNDVSRQVTVCQQAYLFLSDETPTPYLSAFEGRRMVAKQLQILRKCEKFL